VRPDPYSWSLHPEATLPIVMLAVLYGFVFQKHKAEKWRAACFAGGVALLLATAVTPLESLQYHLLTMHLLQNVVLAEWAPALLVLGVPAALAARFRVHPALALAIWLGTYFVWHLPPLYETALEHDALLHLEHVCYLAAGSVFWWPVFHGERAEIVKAAYVFAAFVLAAPVGLLLALLPEPVYDFYEKPLWGLTPLEDQQIAGLTMAGEQSVVLFAVFSFYFFRFLASEEQDQ
jgi:cytochrome c oxidase assembly factor CtaG